MSALTDLLNKAADAAIETGSELLKPRPEAPKPVAPVKASGIPAWLLPVGIVAGVVIVAVLIFRGR